MSPIDSAIAQLEAAFASQVNNFSESGEARQLVLDRVGRITRQLRGLYTARMAGGSLDVFTSECLRPAIGHALKVTDFYNAFTAYCRRNNVRSASHIIVARELRRAGYVIGRDGSTNTAHIANVSLENLPPVGPPLVVNERGRLVPYGT